MSTKTSGANRPPQPSSADDDDGAIAHFDKIGRRTVGWIVDPASGSAPTSFTLKLDDASISVTATVPRPDVVLAGLALHPMVGFSIDTSELLAQWRAKQPKFASPKSLSLIVDGVVVLQRDLPDLSQVTGRLEAIDRDGISGSLSGEALQIVDVDVEIYLDDVLFETVTADRSITPAEVPTKAFHLPIASSLGIDRTFKVDARIMLSGLWLEGGSRVLDTGIDDRLPIKIASVLEGTANPDVSVVIPIFNAAAVLKECLASVRRETTRPANLILIDDGSTEPEVHRILSTLDGQPRVTIRRHARNLGYTTTINEGIELAGTSDVVLLNSDTVVPPRWLENLRFAAYSDHAIATVSPLSNNAGAFAAPEPEMDNTLPNGIAFADVARAVLQASAGTFPDVATTSGFCMYIKRSCLDEAGPFDARAFPRGYGEENDFCMKTMRAGWRHVVDDRTYVRHQRSASFGVQQRANLSEAATSTLVSRYPEYPIMIGALSRSRELALARYRVRRALAHVTRGPRVRPRLLTVISSQSGGTPLANKDLASGLSDDYEVYVLHSDRQALTLSVFSDGELQPVATKLLSVPIRLARHFASAYDQLLGEWLVAYAIELVHVRHIAWHGLGLTAVCNQLEIPVVFSFHDFYTVCPTVKLLDNANRFCGGTCTADDGHCVAELWESNEVPELKHKWVHIWRQQTEAMLESVDAYVTTSEGTRQILARTLPNILNKPFEVIPHGRDFARLARAAVVPRQGQTLRLLVPGNLSEAKGARILRELKELDTEDLLEIHTVGNVASFLNGTSMVHHGPYERDDFVAIAEEVRPHFGLILSIWPETHCHTLTELWAAGIPVVAYDIGAVGERIRQSGGGELIQHISAKALYDTLIGIADNKGHYHKLLAEVLNWQANIAPNETIFAMSQNYQKLYDRVLRARTPFAGHSEAEFGRSH